MNAEDSYDAESVLSMRELLNSFGRWPATPAQKRFRSVSERLKSTASMRLQDLAIEPVDEGWVLVISSRAESGLVRILIPHDASQSVEVLADLRAASQTHPIEELIDAGCFREASHIAEQNLNKVQTQAEKGEADNTQVLYATWQLAAVYRELGRFHRAALLLDDAAQSMDVDTTIGNDLRIKILTDRPLTSFLHKCSTETDFSEVVADLFSAQHKADEWYGTRSEESAYVMHSRGRVAESMYRYQEALPMYESALEIRREVHGNRHPATAETLGQLAHLHARIERDDEAAAEFQEAIDIFLGCERQRDPRLAQLFVNAAEFHYYNRNDVKLAHDYLERALEIWEQTIGLQHPFVQAESSFIAKLVPEYASGISVD